MKKSLNGFLDKFSTNVSPIETQRSINIKSLERIKIRRTVENTDLKLQTSKNFAT
jgi:hypothetical protein